MTDEAKECRNAYGREYYEKNKDKRREYNRKYYQKNKDKFAKYRKNYYEKHKDKIKERYKNYYEKHKEKIYGINKKYRKKDSVLGFCVRLEGESSKKFLRLLEIKRIPRSQFIREAIEKYIKDNENILTDRTLNIIERLKGDEKWTR